jgi:septal ring factor EnvC (AmiA/AmiB activator)
MGLGARHAGAAYVEARMRRYAALTLLCVALGLLCLAGCAGTRTEEFPNDPTIIRHELEEIANDIANTKEILKGSKAELQIEDSMDLRNQIRSLEMELYELESRKASLEQRLRELQAQGVE